MTLKGTIHINPEKKIGTIHPHLYGANLEHIGQSVYGGHWAEMLKSRKFAGPDRMFISVSEGLNHQNPSFGIVEPWRAVNPHYENVLYVHDNTTFYTGNQSQRITIRHHDGAPHGIEQDGLFLEQGRSYRLRLVLKGTVEMLQIHFGEHSQAIRLGPEWQTHEWQVVAGKNDANGCLRFTIEDEGSVWLGAVSLMPSDHLKGHRKEVVEKIKEWQPTFLRWPGGNFVSGYHWQYGIGDRDKRPSYLDPAWHLWETNDVGTDEFIEFCRLIGSEPLLTINMGNGTPQEAAAWVEYCNRDASTSYGQLRIKNGYPDPHQVKTWFVGNEQFGNWQVGHCDAETYAHKYLEFREAMLAIDPHLKLIAVGVPSDLYGHWNELVLKQIADKADALSVHYYSIRTEKWGEPPPPHVLTQAKIAAGHEIGLMLDKTLAVIQKHSAPPMPIAFDEWNTYIAATAPDFFEDYDIADANYVGSLMNACLNRSDRIVMSAVFNLINVMCFYRVTPNAIWKTPSCLVLEMFTQYRGDYTVEYQLETPHMAAPAAGNQPAFDQMPILDAAVSVSAKDNHLFLSIVNRDLAKKAEITLHGITPSSPIKIISLVGASPQDTNTASEPNRVMTQVEVIESTTLTIAPHSVNMVIIKR